MPEDEAGRALPRPTVRHVHSDHEGKLVSKQFRFASASDGTHLTTSPPHDHDLNPIAERIIGSISETATAIRLSTEASPRLWPHIISHAIDYHNGTISSAGSSSTDENISPYQRFTLRRPRVMDLPAFGARAVVLKPPPHQHKPSLSSRGWQGSFLGRTRGSKGCYDVLVDGNKIVRSSSVLVDEERFDWAPKDKQHLTSLSPLWRTPRRSNSTLRCCRSTAPLRRAPLRFLSAPSTSTTSSPGLTAARMGSSRASSTSAGGAE